MTVTSKLDVSKALERLRGTEAPKARIKQLDEKIGALDEEIQRLKATNRQLARSQRTGGPTKRK
jgi:hypothetical protein